jgi:hypothetical protein
MAAIYTDEKTGKFSAKKGRVIYCSADFSITEKLKA